MKGPPSLDEVEIELPTGSSVAIIVEGNSYMEPYSAPPGDLVNMIERIIEHAGL